MSKIITLPELEGHKVENKTIVLTDLPAWGQNKQDAREVEIRKWEFTNPEPGAYIVDGFSFYEYKNGWTLVYFIPKIETYFSIMQVGKHFLWSQIELETWEKWKDIVYTLYKHRTPTDISELTNIEIALECHIEQTDPVRNIITNLDDVN